MLWFRWLGVRDVGGALGHSGESRNPVLQVIKLKWAAYVYMR